MADLSSLAASFGMSIELAKGLLKVKEIADSAEAKMAIAELTSKLAESQVQIADLKVEHLAKDEAIREFEKRLAERQSLVRFKELYFEVDEGGEPLGDPYCPRCHEADGRSIHLVYHGDYRVKCPECEKDYPRTPGVNRPIKRRAVISKGHLGKGAW